MKLKKIKLTILCLCIAVIAIGQEGNGFFEQIKYYDLSNLIETIEIQKENTDSSLLWWDYNEFIGFVGENFQRFYIHFISIKKDPSNPHAYSAYGKTKTRNNICEFHGTLLVTDTKLFRDCGEMEGEEIISFDDSIYCGTITFHIKLLENPEQKNSGTIEGSMYSTFKISEKQFNYVGYPPGDQYCNHQFSGIWRSSKTGKTKKCNFGVGRIPFDPSSHFDIGASEFGVNPRYEKFGWEMYSIACCESDYHPKKKEAIRIEMSKWWE
jgi:hypothetical protein